MTAPVRFRTNGKVNLFLRVLGLRPDGFHEIETILHGVSIADEITVTPTSTGRVDVEMAGAPGPPPGENLAARAVAALTGAGARHHGLRIEIDKRIPVAAGMGGGSANAGGILVVLNELLGPRLARPDLARLALALGSDVPYCLEGGTALATGRGEHLTPLVVPVTLSFVLGISRRPLSTATVYAAWDEVGTGAERGRAPLTLALGEGDVEAIGAHLHNDLETAAFSLRPDLAAKKEGLLEAGCAGALMSGSGPTVFGLCRDEAEARRVAEEVAGVFDRVEVVQSRRHCVERPQP